MAAARAAHDNGTATTADDIPAIAAGQAIAISPTGTQADSHLFEKNIKGLTDGNTYYVHVVDSGSFQLMNSRADAMANTNAVQIDNSDTFQLTATRTVSVVTRTGTHHIGTTGIDLVPGTQTQSLRFDLSSQPTGGEHRLSGPGGVSLSSIAPPPGDGLSGVRATGGSGGGADFAFPSAVLTGSFTVTSHVDATSVIADGDVSITALSASGVSTYADTTGGGGLSVGKAYGDTRIASSPTRAYVGANTLIIAGDDVAITAGSDHAVGAAARSTGGGGIAGKIAYTTARLDHTTEAFTQTGVRITAGDALAIRSSSKSTGTTSTYTLAIAVGAGADSDDTNGERGVILKAASTVTVGAGSILQGNTIDIDAGIDKADGRADARSEAYSVIFFSVATAFSRAKVDIDADATVNLNGSTTRITGIQGVDIQAHQTGVKATRNASQIAVALIPPQNSFAEGTVTLDSSVKAVADLVVSAGARNVSRTGEDLAAGQSGLVGNGGLGQAMALFGSAKVDAPVINAGPGAATHGEVRWDADVVVLGGLNGSPELVVDASGKVVRANAVTVDGATPVVGTAADADGDGTITVGAIANGGNGGILFYADDMVRNATTPGATGWPLFDFRAGLSGVSIIDASGKILRIDDIDVISPAGAAAPLVRMVTKADQVDPVDPGTPYTLQFDLQRNAGPTLVDIQKRGANDLQLNGTINNPTGWTHILNTQGDIVSTHAAGRVWTNVLDIEATDGQIGSAGSRVNVALVQSIDRVDARVAGDDKLRTTRLYGNAASDIFLQVKAYDRVPVEHALRPSEFTVYIGRVQSVAGSVDLLLEESVQQPPPVAPGQVRVQVYDSSPSVKTFDGLYSRHFLPDGGTVLLDAGAYATGGTAVASTYRFEERQARPEGTVRHFAGTTVDYLAFDGSTLVPLPAPATLPVTGIPGLRAGGNIVVTAKNSAPGDTRINVDGFTDVTANGHIDVLTNGYITLVEPTGDLRVGLIRSRASDVSLTALDASIVDARQGDGTIPSGDTPSDVVGDNVTLLAALGTIGSDGNFLEIDSSSFDGTPTNGVLDARALGDIRITETVGDLRLKRVDAVQGDVSLVSRAGSLVDGRIGGGLVTDAAVILANSVDLQAIGGSIGQAAGNGGDIEIDSSRQSTGDVGLEAGADIYLTEVNGTLRLVQARTPIDPATTGGGNIHLTVRESEVANSLNENLHLLASGSVLFVENAPRTVADGFIRAGGWVELRIGDDFVDHANTLVTAGLQIDIYLDDLNNGSVNGDAAYGANTTLLGTVTPGAGQVTSIYGRVDVDRITFDQTTLGGYTRVYGSNVKTTAGGTAPLGDGEDIFTVNRLQTMTVGTLTLDGQAGSDHYLVNTSGSQGADRNYIVNALDTGASDDGVDVLSIYGADGALNGIDPATGLPHATDDIFLLRGLTAIAGLNGNEEANRAAFVGVLHGSLADAQDGVSTAVERINYDAAINGRLEVFGQGGNDSFATDDNSAVTSLDGGLGDDSFQIGQLYGSRRNTLAHLDPNDVFATVATTRGWLSRGNSSALVAQGGAGNDQFTVYANQAALRLEGDAGNDLFTVRAFALADTAGGTEGATKAYEDGGQTRTAVFHDGIWWRTYDATDASKSSALPALASAFSTAAETDVRTGGGDNQVEYNINAPVSIDGGTGFDKVVVLGTEFADHIVITDTGIYGAGMSVTYENVEVLEIDGLEGDDSFDVLSTAPGLVTRVIGGLGSDAINVGGDVVGAVFARDIEGSSGAINHLVTSDDVRYNGKLVDGIDLSVVRPGQGAVIITESAGFTSVREGSLLDSYTVSLATAPTTDVYITVSAALSQLDERGLGADSIWLSTDPNEFHRRFTDYYVPGTQPTGVPQHAIVLHFKAGESAAQTVYVKAPADGVAEGDRKVVISHSVISADAAYDTAQVRNVEVEVKDVDQPAIELIAVDKNGNPDKQSLVLEGDATTGITDQYRVHLAIPPAAGTMVSIDITVGDPRVVLSGDPVRFTTVTARTPTTPGVYRVTFTAADASDVLVTMTAVDDFAAQDPRTTVLTHTVNAALTSDARYDDASTGAAPQSLYVQVRDNDSAGVLVLPSDGSTLVNPGDPSQTDSYTLRLTTAPTADVKIAVFTDGQTDVVLGGRVQLAAVGTPLNGLYAGAVTWDSATRTLTRTDGGSWLDAGFLEGQLLRFNGATCGDAYKIQLIHGTTLDQLTLTPSGATPGLADGPVTVTQWAAHVTFTSTNWYQAVTVEVKADPAYALRPGAEDTKVFAKRPHLLGGIQGPLQVEGGTTAADRSLRRALLLPGETNGPFFGIAPQASEATQIDVLNVYADSSVEDLVGEMSSTTITGLNMGTGLDFGAQGFTQTAFGESLTARGGIGFGTLSIGNDGKVVTDGGFSTIEVVNVLLGEGNDRFTINGTLKPGADLSTGVAAVHGGITAVHGGGNSLLQVAAPFDVARAGGDTLVTRGDGLAWADYGFAVGQALLFDGVSAGTVSALAGNQITVTGAGVPLADGAVHRIGVLDPLGNDRNRVPNPYGSTLPADATTRVGGDTLIVKGGGGADSPLVVYGDTSQDGVWYQGDPTRMSAHDFGPKPWGTELGNGAPDFYFAQAGFFHWFGNDVIDARQDTGLDAAGSLQLIGINAYGGAGDDTIYGSQTGDRLAGGSGDDIIEGQRGADLIYGVSGLNVDLITRELTMVTHLGTVPTGSFDVIDHLAAGKDLLSGEGAGSLASANVADFADVIFGDHGVVVQDTAGARITRVAGQLQTLPTLDPRLQTVQSVGRLIDLATVEAGNGADDVIGGDAGRDRIFGGNGSDSIGGGTEADVIFGDQVHMGYLSADYYGIAETAASDANLATLDVVESIDTAAAYGKADTITDDASDDIIFGGQGNDLVDAGGGQNIVFGDHGRILGVDTGANTPVIDANIPVITKPDDDYQVQVLGLVTSIDPGTRNAANEFGNGDDRITTGSGRDMIFGGGGSDIIDAFGSGGGTAAADGNNIVFGDHGLVDYLAEEIGNPAATNPPRTNDIDRIWSLATAFGDNDTIKTGNRNDIVLGGFGDDTIDTGGGANIAMGDSGRLTSDETDATDRGTIKFAVHDFIICKIETSSDGDFSEGGTDTIIGGDQNDVLFGGGGNDAIYAGAGDDLVFGDQGMVECKNDHPFDPTTSLRPVCWDIYPPLANGQPDPRNGFLEFSATHTLTLSGSGDDTLFGQDGSDLLMGEQGSDTLYGGNGDDILIGGSNVAGSLDGDDRLDGGAGTDAIAGDNADICFRPDALDVRMRNLDGTAIHGIVPGVDDGQVLVGIGAANADNVIDPSNPFLNAQADPRYTVHTSNDNSGHAEYHIELLDHSDDIQAHRPELFGDDYIAGGAGEDEIFGQLGNDVIQGDGTVGVAAGTEFARNLAAAQLSLTRSDGTLVDIAGFTAYGAYRDGASGGAAGDLAIGTGDLHVAFSFEGQYDGDDYIEGNGGNDVIFGNVGQDDIVGGSSDLYGFVLATQRPDGSDLIFGGAGTDITRNDIGDAITARSAGLPGSAPDDLIVNSAGSHAHDADVIVGDNGRILRLVGVNKTQRPTTGDVYANGVWSTGGFLNFNNDVNGTAADGYGSDGNAATYDRIVVRAVTFLDYHEGGIDISAAAAGDRGAADEVHGESGDDVVYAMKGNDVLYGEGQSDDLIGGYGNDWISGGTGDDGVIGDDGRIMTSRNATAYGEPLAGALALLPDDGDTRTFNGNMVNELIATPGAIQQAVINVAGELKKSVNLTPLSYDPNFNGITDEFTSTAKKTIDDQGQPGAHNADDIIFGGLGSDWLHGGSGDDAILGGDALATANTQVYDAGGKLAGIARSDYGRPYDPVDGLRYNPLDPDGWHFDRTRRAGEFALYDEYDPLRKITLNADGTANKTDIGGLAWFADFATDEGVYRPSVDVPTNGKNVITTGPVHDDGNDRIFGDTGNDWLVGGTGRDDLYGGFGNDLLNVDDNQETDLLRNDVPDTHPTYEDRAYGGAGRDVLIANTGGDRLIDWVGEFNSYLVPFAPFGMATVSRTLQPQLAEFLYALSASDGADPTRAGDTGKEAARNGEPEGELGVVRQKDVAWQSQTGAPADPQAGNIPGGKRDVLRTASFNDGLLQGFAPDSGSWTVSGGTLQVAATSLHGDAVSVFQIGDALPAYFEVQATVKANKPTSGWNANAFVIFDYQDKTNFKFAGIDVSSNKLVMGHRDASGWIVDKQASFPGSVKSDTYYNLLLTVNGLVATLYVNGGNAFGHTYAASIVDGYSYGLNWGLVGFGSNNSQGSMDDLAVQIVPPAATVVKIDEFGGPGNSLFAGGPANVSGGTYTLAGGRYSGSPSGSDAAISLANIGGVTNLSALSILDLNATLSTTARAGFVFDRYSATDFKFVAIDVQTKQVLIGHRQGNHWAVDAVASKSTLSAGTDYQVGVTLRGSTVSVTLNGQTMVSYAYNGVIIDGRFGVFAKGGSVSLETATFRTNDASVPATLNLAGAMTSSATTALAPTAEQLQPLVAEAIRRWSMVEDAALVAGLRGIDVVFARLDNGELAEYRNGVITLDVDAAGQGWFVDPTPSSDEEFGGAGDTLTARAGAAVGRIDLLSVLAHEMGHAMGFAHSDSGVMAEGLLPGQRATPDRWFAPALPPQSDRLPTMATDFGSVPAPILQIDWGPAPASATTTRPPANAPSAARPSTPAWQTRFVNHLGASAERMNPNAALRLHVNLVPPVTTSLVNVNRP
jgi:Ca2+-binding RTX toxin-like protein